VNKTKSYLEGSLDDGHDEGQGRGVDEVDELGLEQGGQARRRLFGRILERFEQDGHDGLDFRVADHRADDLQGLGAGRLHFDVAVAQHFDQFGYDPWQAGRQLARSAVGHGSQQFHRSRFRSERTKQLQEIV